MSSSKSKRPSASTELGVAPYWASAQRVCSAVFSRYGIKVYLVTKDAHDTVFSYLLKTDERVYARDLLLLRAFIEGVVAGYASE